MSSRSIVAPMPQTLLTLSCPDRVGLLSRITTFVAERGGNLCEVNQHTDIDGGWFFARLAIESHTLGVPLEELRTQFAPVATGLGGQWSIRRESDRLRVVVMVSRQGHCLVDLLWRWRAGELNCEIVGVLSNHEDFRAVVEREGIPFHHIAVVPGEKARHFAEVEALWRELRADVVVLARYMQIVPAEVCERWSGQVMNIHHSFLPSFVGANPYQRAWERGVKMIGATCHYVTSELDDGPIIEQEVVRVEHFHDPADMLRMGRDVERQALARGVRWHLAGRILLHGRRAVVFRD
jgi:formyltetrahydrofolate deformylase